VAHTEGHVTIDAQRRLHPSPALTTRPGCRVLVSFTAGSRR
jgi:hypothetical protein